MNNRTLVFLALYLHAASSGCEAFVPTTKRQLNSGNLLESPVQSSFVGSRASVPAGTSTSLSMMASSGNLFDRFFRVLRSNVNKFVSSIENPEKVIVQAVEDMQVSISML